jgi:hypothetical protein
MLSKVRYKLSSTSRFRYTYQSPVITVFMTVEQCYSAFFDEGQRRLDSRPQSIMGIERLIPRVTSLTVDCRGVNISLTKPIWKLSNDKSVRYFVKTAYCCIVAILIMTCVLLYQVYLFLNCMGRAVILD